MAILSILDTLKNCLHENQKTIDDIIWVGCREYCIPVENFIELASKFYYTGYMKGDIPEDLLVVGTDFWVEVFTPEFGEDEWMFKTMPKRPQRKEILKTLHRRELTKEESAEMLIEADNSGRDSGYAQMWQLLYKK